MLHTFVLVFLHIIIKHKKKESIYRKKQQLLRKDERGSINLSRRHYKCVILHCRVRTNKEQGKKNKKKYEFMCLVAQNLYLKHRLGYTNEAGYQDKMYEGRKYCVICMCVFFLPCSSSSSVWSFWCFLFELLLLLRLSSSSSLSNSLNLSIAYVRTQFVSTSNVCRWER